MVGQGRAGLLASIRAEVKRILEARVENGEEVLAFESDQLITLDNTRDWRFSELHTEVENGDADVQAFLNMPMRGLPDNSQLLHSYDIIPAAYSTPEGKNCAVHQMAELLGLDYHGLVDEFRELFVHTYGECEESAAADLPFVTPALVVQWAQRHEHSCYFLKHNTLVYRHVSGGRGRGKCP